MSFETLTEEQKEARRKAAREWKKRNKERRVGGQYLGRPIASPAGKERQKLREANRRAYAKKTGAPVKFPTGNQHGEYDQIGSVSWASLKEKHKQWEGTRLEKSLRPIILLRNNSEAE